MIARVESLKAELLESPRLREFAGEVWESVKHTLAESLADEHSELRAGLRSAVIEVGSRLASDEELAAKVDAWVADAAAYVVRTYRHEIAGVITETVERWDPARDRPRSSSSRWAATCSSSASTAPWSARSPGSRSSRSRPEWRGAILLRNDRVTDRGAGDRLGGCTSEREPRRPNPISSTWRPSSRPTTIAIRMSPSPTNAWPSARRATAARRSTRASTNSTSSRSPRRS